MTEIKKQNSQVSPFLRWTGSKRWFVNKYINEFLPKKFNNYHEPFLGAGSVFFHIKNISEDLERKYYLSDSNKDLINTYLQIRDNLSDVINHLKKMSNTPEFYYKTRSKKLTDNAKRAAQFIYLNKTSFNGIYRVNSKGEYNVPYGKRKNVDFINESLLSLINQNLQNITFNVSGFYDSLKNIKENDLVFLDPPYTIAHENNGFIEYNQKLFSWDDQIKLKSFLDEIKNKGAYFILTNASHHSINDLYKNTGDLKVLSRYSQVGGRNKTRGTFNEVVIYNTTNEF